MRTAILSLTAISLSGAAQAGLGGLYLETTDSRLWWVDGGTLQAHEIRHLPEVFGTPPGFLVRDIHYLGNDRFVLGSANQEISILDLSDDSVVQADLDFGDQHLLFGSAGFTTDAQGRLVTSGVFTDGPPYSLYNADLAHGVGDRLETLGLGNGIPEDIALMGASDQLLYMLHNDSLRVVDRTSGITIHESDYSGLYLTSFIETEGSIYALGDEGMLYEIDQTTYGLSEYGQIEGFNGFILSGTVPSPGALGMLGFAGLVGTRRRR